MPEMTYWIDVSATVRHGIALNHPGRTVHVGAAS
jgi:hypothetical protein